MLTLKQAQEKLKDRNLKSIQETTGLKYFVLRRIRLGEHDGIKAEDLQVLSDYLERA
jgi:hypothetical protein